MTSTNQLLRATRFDPALTPGARNAVENCLRIQPDEKVTLITDRACSEIGAALAQAAGAAGTGELSADSNIGSGAPTIKDQQVSFEGDVVHGQFLAEILELFLALVGEVVGVVAPADIAQHASERTAERVPRQVIRRPFTAGRPRSAPTPSTSSKERRSTSRSTTTRS